MTRIAVVGMACRYPDAASPLQLWENALAGRRAFRRLPDERMRLDDYWDPDPAAPDRFYTRHAAVIEGYRFDRVRYQVAGSTYRSTDLTHWLALDVAAQAIADAGYPMAEGLPLERTQVVVGNSLTGEFTRANTMRLRWPYVRRVTAAALRRRGWDGEQVAAFLADLEAAYKEPFPPIDEDSLAGGLSNTIAGRICNHFDFKGGGFTVDGACSSSLLSVAMASKALLTGDVDVAIAGGVDLSIDPFEIVGFAKTGALATGEMRVYDSGSNGFWPGEGCGMVVLMREADAVAQGRKPYALIAGWGISSDGRGGITRPELGGYRLALRRAYAQAGFGIDTVSLFEGHGTGTKVGDDTELRALSRARADAGPGVAGAAAIGSIKAMIGHTKAAAGVAGLIKAVLAVHHAVLPPTVGCVQPHRMLTEEGATLRALPSAEPFPPGAPVRAGVTAMGFGGINTHVVLDRPDSRRRASLDHRTRTLSASAQDAELLLFDATSPGELRQRLVEVADRVARLAFAQLADLAATLHGRMRGRPHRAAVVAATPEEAERLLRKLISELDAGQRRRLAPDEFAFLGNAGQPGQVGFLFPGQGAGRGTSGGALRRRFAVADEVYTMAALPVGGDMAATQVAQPRIVAGSLAGLRVLSTLDINASVAVGHSLGEITAVHWAGALDAATLLRVAAARGRVMSEHGVPGTMASLAAGPDATARLLDGLPVVIAAYNGPLQTVVSGTEADVRSVLQRARDAGITGAPIAVSHAFHSPLVAPAAGAFAEVLAGERFARVTSRVISTVTGGPLTAETDLPALLRRQITDPVLFGAALDLAAKEVDLLVEVGPGRILTGLARAVTDIPAFALDAGHESLRGLLRIAAAAFVTGVCDSFPALFDDRLVRPLDLRAEPVFFTSPCETVPVDLTAYEPSKTPVPAVKTASAPAVVGSTNESTLDLLRRLVAARAELPVEIVRADSRLLDDLHLSSITVGQVVNEAAQQVGAPAALLPTNFATASLLELAEAIDTIAAHTGSGDVAPPVVSGAAPWVRAWRVDAEELPGATPVLGDAPGQWQVFAPADDELAAVLADRLRAAPVGDGVLVRLPRNVQRRHVRLAFDAALAAISRPEVNRFVLVQSEFGAAGLAKTLRLEQPRLRTTVICLPPDMADLTAMADRIVAEVAGTNGFTEVHFDTGGARRVPTLRALPMHHADATSPLDAADVLLVTGGGKGITAECALAMALDSGAAVGLVGRSDPATDPELAANLARMTAAGVRVRYARADVTDAEQTRRAIAEVAADLGAVTAILHGAGRNEPAALPSLDFAAFEQTFAPKLDGLHATLAAIDPQRLRLLVTFGSIIGRTGLRGEAHYATANEWLAAATAEFGRKHPGCRTLCLEWSVWSGVGMGERLAVVETLVRQGITPVTPDQGVAVLRRLLADPRASGTIVVTGRTGELDTVRYAASELPLLRFVDRPLVHYPGVELVVETRLALGSDPYLADHRLDGNLLFPAVLGLEAMAQVGAALTGRDSPPVIDHAEFARPIVVASEGGTTIRVAATVTGDDTVAVAISSEETAFGADHFRATLRYGAEEFVESLQGVPDQAATALAPVPLDTADLYRDVLFQGPRFQRLSRYHRVSAHHADAELIADPAVDWFAAYLPSRLLLGDPGLRDALMHGNQICVPNATLLPQGVGRIHPAGSRLVENGQWRFSSVQRHQEGDSYVYDVVLRDGAGAVVERWEGLRLRAVRKRDGARRGASPWLAPLLGPYLERAMAELIGAGVAVAVEPDGSQLGQRRSRTAIAAARALGRPVDVRYRPDGRPLLDGDGTVSASHAAGLTLCAATDEGNRVVACDVEPVVRRADGVWRRLLGARVELAGTVAAQASDDADAAATRVWAALECLQKAGQSPSGPLVLASADPGGWVVFASGELRIATLVTAVQGSQTPVALAVLATRDR
ncbi:type I polyketide synthase [Allorhizocola rhizosphaerae]|uniref:type I polyketide synthase n=1 Tax=Allorhizocola rhizosphaerae TaxID=1872709 RepID=UPI000E3D4900|nr:type I polyketide synthase [Allorhizocola rhizosphaerae]